MNTLVSSESVYWCQSHDRYIRVHTVGDVVVGINYMQGDELEIFEENKDIDSDLTNFYNAVCPYLNGGNEIENINLAIWAHFDYENNPLIK